ncbi:tRNA (N6-threonylcarbamoyladenosine(37)-N6)-methyltransferase TrmO [Desulfohalovibrio reitneri]|uniref:tRNA (N6-threonylcarbamoyladenosine(37)-N6)-methyltransferase TrmO n=1 Tax=Desulfohalovibrio reitneri TaxID=1307759 RepID=UPI0004A6AE17|nr:tRNA (N6-threonylcarbamoyladenosine(37)-N6)-methyltransferase TrmO [Desulfohalovibrio reitneri]
MSLSLNPIGIMRTPHRDIEGMPIQPPGAGEFEGTLHLRPELAEGLRDLDGFSHVHLIYLLHKVEGYELTVKPFLDDAEHGIFATRSPSRPAPIGLSVLEVLQVRGNTVRLGRVDMLDRTPVLDIKPYVPDFDVWPADRIGWFAGKSGNADSVRADGRFRESGRRVKRSA